MDTPKLVMKKSARLSIGKHRLSNCTKSATKTLDFTSILHTPPSTKSDGTPNTNNDVKCSTPVTRKKAFIAEESPSQDYECFSPVIQASQDARNEYQDVGWEWDEKPSKPVHYPDKRDDKAKHKCIASKSRCKTRVNSLNPDKQSTPVGNRGFYIFQKEIENIKQNNWNLNSDELDGSLKENLETPKATATSDKDISKNKEALKDLPRAKSAVLDPRISPVSSRSRNVEKSGKEASFTLNCFDDSDMDAMLLEVSQTVEANPTKSSSAKEATKEVTPEELTTDLIGDYSFGADSELFKFSPNYSKHFLPLDINQKGKSKAEILSTQNQGKSSPKNGLITKQKPRYNTREATGHSKQQTERVESRNYNHEKEARQGDWDWEQNGLDNSLKENVETIVSVAGNGNASKNAVIQARSTTKDLPISKSTVPANNRNNNAEKNAVHITDSSLTLNGFDDSDMDAILLEASQTVEENYTKISHPKDTIKEAEQKKEDNNFDTDFIDDILLSIPDDDLYNPGSYNLSTCLDRKSLFSRHNSMPRLENQRNENCGQVKNLNRHNSMPPGKACSSSTTNNCARNGPKEYLNSGTKRLCTKEEMERKRLEAKKRQMISQQKRMMLNQHNILNPKGRNVNLSSSSSNSSSLKSVKR